METTLYILYFHTYDGTGIWLDHSYEPEVSIKNHLRWLKEGSHYQQELIDCYNNTKQYNEQSQEDNRMVLGVLLQKYTKKDYNYYINLYKKHKILLNKI